VTGCEDCAAKDKSIMHLEHRIKDLHGSLHSEKKRTTVLSEALVQIYGVARDNMWYPSSFAERGEDGFAPQQAYIDADVAVLSSRGTHQI
jgi:hypothetical protein